MQSQPADQQLKRHQSTFVGLDASKAAPQGGGLRLWC